MNSPIVSMSPNALSKEVADVGVEKVLEAIRSGKYADQIEAVRVVYQEEGKKAARPLKANLPAILFSGRFKQREDSGIRQHSGILVADLDELDCPIPELRATLKEDPHVIFVFLSPTGSGLKVGFKVPADADRHAASFAAVDAHVKQEYGEDIDPACRNLSRLCFTSHDPDLYVNWESVDLEVPDTITPSQSQKDDSHEREIATAHDIRLQQLQDLAASDDPDVAEIAEADIFREFGDRDNGE